MSIFFANSSKRIYEDKELNKISSLLFDKGVFNTKKQNITDWREDGDFKVKAEDTPSLTVMANSGNAVVPIFINNEKQNIIISENTSLSATVNENTSASLRNDAVILRVNQEIIANDQLNEEGSNALSMVVIAGSRPDPLTDGEIAIAVGNDPFIRLANIEVKSGVNEITQNDIKDARHLAGLTKKAKLETELLRIWGVDKDPEMISLGDIWYNQSEGILKMFDGENTVAIQSQSFDWGYYPPNGVERYEEVFKSDVSNDSISNIMPLQAWGVDSLSPKIKSIRQIFRMPDVEDPLIRIKFGNTTASGYKISVYTTDSENRPHELKEEFTFSDSPKNEYVSIALDGELYSTGEIYTITIMPTMFYTTGDRRVEVLSSVLEDEKLLGTQEASTNTPTGDPLDLTWAEEYTENRSFIMEIREREEIKIGETDVANSNYQIIQPFVAKSKDIEAIYVVRGKNVESPTATINFKIYKADQNGIPTGDIITQSEVDSATWNSKEVGERVEVEINTDELSVGSRYCFVIDSDSESDTDNYTIFFGSTKSVFGESELDPLGAYRHNTSEGYVRLFGQIYFGIKVTTYNKIIVSNNQGNIDPRLKTPNVLELYVNEAKPEYSIDYDLIYIGSISENITSMSDNMKGNPKPFQKLTFLFLSTASRNITWGTKFQTETVALPISIPANKYVRVVVEYLPTGKFGCISADIQA